MRSLRVLIPIIVLTCGLVALGVDDFTAEQTCLSMGPSSCYTTHTWSLRYMLLGGGVGLLLSGALVGSAFLLYRAMRHHRSQRIDPDRSIIRNRV